MNYFLTLSLLLLAPIGWADGFSYADIKKWKLDEGGEESPMPI